MQQDTAGLTLSKCHPASHPIIMALSPSDTLYPNTNVDWRQRQLKVRFVPPLLTAARSGPGTPESDDNCLAAWGCISEVSLHRNVSAAVCTVCSIIIALSRKCPLCHCHSDYNVLYAGECVVSAVRHPDIFPAQTETKVRRNILTLRKHQKKSQPWMAL